MNLNDYMITRNFNKLFNCIIAFGFLLMGYYIENFYIFIVLLSLIGIFIIKYLHQTKFYLEIRYNKSIEIRYNKKGD